jgi:hypothetical protein
VVDQAQCWVQALYSKKWTDIFHRLAKKLFGDVVDTKELAEDARQLLAMKLSRIEAEEDSSGRSDGYLLVSYKYALVDAHRALFGRAKPRKWLSDLGAIGKRLFQLRCIERLSVRDVIAKVHDELSSLRDSSVSETQVREILQEMDRRHECERLAGKQVSLDDTHDDEQPVIDEPSAPENENPEERAARDQAVELQQLLFGPTPERLTPAVRKRLENLQRKSGTSLLLDDEECLILQYFCNEMPEGRVGELLGGISVRQVRYRREQALEKIKRFFADCDLSLDDLIE